MKNPKKYTLAKIFCLLVGYISSYVLLCQSSFSFKHYTELFFYMDDIEVNKVYFIMALILGAVSFAAYGYFVWKSDKSKENSLMHRFNNVDYMLFVLICLSIALMCVYAILMYTNVYFFVSPMIAYTAGIALFTTTLVRIRDKSLVTTMYWVDFFRVYGLNKPFGITMAVLIAANLYTLFEAVNISPYRFFIHIYALRFVISLISLWGLTFFCKLLKSLSLSYEMANEDKIKAERFKTELITNVSHDIRTPLTSIINYIDLIKRLQIQNPNLEEYTNILDKKSIRLKLLINDLMDASKAGTGNVPVNMEEINLTELIGQIAGEYDSALTNSQLTFVFNEPAENIAVLADGRHLWRVMENIFINAVKYSMTGTRIYADIKQEKNRIVFSLKNISKEPLGISSDELMERFVRGDHARNTEGSGLGLYIAKSLMEIMGGQLTILNHGDLFEVLLDLNQTHETQ